MAVLFSFAALGEQGSGTPSYSAKQAWTNAAEVPFRLAGGDNPLILVAVQVNGRGPFEFILDTGASTCLLTPEVGQAVGVRITGSKTGHGAGGSLEISLGTAESVALGALRVHEVQVGITDDLKHIGAAIGAKVDGNIGYNLLRDFRVTINYHTQRLRLEPAIAAPGAADGIPFELNPKKPLILLPANVNGHGPFRFILDTGASAMALSKKAAAAAELLAGPATLGVTGGGGTLAVSAARMDSITVGRHTVRNLEAMVVDFLEPLGQVVGSRLDGIVGYNFLRQFEVTIDYPNRVLCLLRLPTVDNSREH